MENRAKPTKGPVHHFTAQTQAISQGAAIENEAERTHVNIGLTPIRRPEMQLQVSAGRRSTFILTRILQRS